MSSGEALENTERMLKEITESGKRIIGYLYAHLPIELVMAHDLVPVLLWGDSTVQGAFEDSLQTFACSYARNIYSQRARDKFSTLEGLIFPGNTCDSLQNVGDIWRFRFPDDKLFRLTYPVAPHTDASRRYFTIELHNLSKSFEEVLETSFSVELFEKATALTSEFREHLQFIYAARLLNPSVISYTTPANLIRQFLSAPGPSAASEVTEAARAVRKQMSSLELTETTEALRMRLLSRDLDPVSSISESSQARLLVLGGMVEPRIVAELIESTPGANGFSVVLDLLSFGFKTIFTPTPSSDGDPFEELARATLSSPLEPTHEGLDERLGFLRQVLTILSIDGVVICEQSFCDPDEFEAPSLESVTKELDIPTIRLPIDPELSDRARLEVRLESFLESISGRS